MNSPSGYGYGPPGPPPGGYGYQPQPGYGPPPAQSPYGMAMNPYAPPTQAPAVVYGAQTRSTGAVWTWLFVSCYGLFVLCVGLGVALREDIGAVLIFAGLFFRFMNMVLGPIWLYSSWDSVPPQMRYTASGRWITPGSAAGLLFVPFYNLYWIFVANTGLCDALNNTTLATGGQPRASKGLAITACVVQLLPYINLVFAPIVWAIYMFVTDGAKKEMLARSS